MIVKVRSHTVYKLKDGRHKCEVWYINENGETKRITHTNPSSILIAICRSNPNAEFVIAQRNGDPVSKSYILRVMTECVKEACG